MPSDAIKQTLTEIYEGSELSPCGINGMTLFERCSSVFFRSTARRLLSWNKFHRKLRRFPRSEKCFQSHRDE